MITNKEIMQRLLDLPSEIARAEEQVEDAKYDFDKAKLQLSANQAKKALELKAKKIKNKKIPVKDIELTLEQECLTEKIALLQMESKYKKAKVSLNRLIKEHDSMKAIAYLKQREIKNGISD